MGRPTHAAGVGLRVELAAAWRRTAIWGAMRYLGVLHPVTAEREDSNGVRRPLTGPCRLLLVDGQLVPTGEPGSDEENVALLDGLDDGALLAVLPYPSNLARAVALRRGERVRVRACELPGFAPYDVREFVIEPDGALTQADDETA